MDRPIAIPRNADLVFNIHEPTPEYVIERLQAEVREHFSGHRAIIVSGAEMTVTQIPRPHKHRRVPSLLAHGGRTRW